MNLPRAGLDLIDKRNAEGAVAAIKRAEERGVPMLWSTVSRGMPDSPTFFAAAAYATESIGLGTAIVPTYPRHPAVLASQALALSQLAPDRFRLGVGPSHQPFIQDVLGLPMGKPLEHLREYVTVLRGLLHEGKADFDGAYYSVHMRLDQTAAVPIYISALRQHAFQLAGEVADGAISWMCPVEYLRSKAAPAMQLGARAGGRPVPRLVAHVPVVMTEDRDTMLRVARPRVASYGRLPFYAAMFRDAGYPVGPGGEVSDDLLDHLVVWGSNDEVRRRLEETLGGGIDELLVMLIPGANPEDEEARLSRAIVEVNQG